MTSYISDFVGGYVVGFIAVVILVILATSKQKHDGGDDKNGE